MVNGKNMKLKQTEHQIQKALMEYCAYKDIKVWRNNSGRAYVGDGVKKRVIILGETGLPDIIGVFGKSWKELWGRMIAIEVKVPSNVTTESQDRQINDLLDHHAIVFVTHSIEELEKQLTDVYEKNT